MPDDEVEPAVAVVVEHRRRHADRVAVEPDACGGVGEGEPTVGDEPVLEEHELAEAGEDDEVLVAVVVPVEEERARRQAVGARIARAGVERGDREALEPEVAAVEIKHRPVARRPSADA